MTDKILLGHGSGGQLSHDLIKNLFVRYFDSDELKKESDSAILNIPETTIAYTTDSYVVDPIFFKGGNIGKLAIAGTVNDLAVSGAIPGYISSSFIIEEGLPIKDLEKIVATMSEEATKAGVKIVTGDTKVVNRGKCDKIFINTSGIGVVQNKHIDISNGKNIKEGDIIIINGSVGDHGIAIMSERNELKINAEISSDCACLNHIIKDILDSNANIKFMRDATRGGLATVLAEMTSKKLFGIEINEEAVPVKESVRGLCELLGFDPFYVANEGKFVLVVDASDAESVLKIMKNNELGKEAAIIGKITGNHKGTGYIDTTIGGRRFIEMLSGEQLPRIC